MLATSEDASITILCLAWGGSALGHGQGGGSGERDVQSQWDGLGGVCVARRGVRRMRIQDGVLNQGFFLGRPMGRGGAEGMYIRRFVHGFVQSRWSMDT